MRVNNYFVLGAISIIIILIFSLNGTKPFYGFEYEDCFVNSSVAISPDLSESTRKFRTYPSTERESSIQDRPILYTGHYVPYASYLWLAANVIKFDNAYMIHKVCNFLLIFITLLLCLYLLLPEDKNYSLSVICICLCTLPVIYVLNSALKENLSFCIGLILVVASLRGDKYLYLIFILVLFLTLVKRENLVYMLIPFALVNKDSWLSYRLVLPTLVIVLVQIYINPFFTEGVESDGIGRNTFSYDFFQFQAPVFFKAFVHYLGFGLLFIIILFTRLSKRSLFFFTSWFVLILIYSSHYRSVFAIEEKYIPLFDTYRYIVNSVPLIIGMILHGDNEKIISKPIINKSILAMGLISLIINLNILSNYVEDEGYNYHFVSKYIKENHEDCTILDNFSLISMLDHYGSSSVDIRELNSTSINEDWKEPVFVINRFNLDSISSWLKEEDTLVNLRSRTGVPDLFVLLPKSETSKLNAKY